MGHVIYKLWLKGCVLEITKMTLIIHVSKHISLRLLLKFPNNLILYLSFNEIDKIKQNSIKTGVVWCFCLTTGVVLCLTQM